MTGRDALHRDRRLAGVYDTGNAMPEASMRAWVQLLAGYRGDDRLERVLDVGSGTAVWACAISRLLDVEVVAVELSREMIERGQERVRTFGVRQVCGRGEHVPLRGESVDLALLSRVIHHIADRLAVFSELRRVVRSSGVVVIRTTFREGLDSPVYTYFPELRAIDEARFPSADDVVDEVESSQFRVVARDSIALPIAPDLRSYRERLELRPMSKFKFLDRSGVEDGLRRLDEAVAEGGHVGPVYERYDVLVAR